MHGLHKNARNEEVSISMECELTFALEDGVPGVPPGIIGVEGVPEKRTNGKKDLILF